MKKIFMMFAIIGVCGFTGASFAVSAGTVSASDSTRFTSNSYNYATQSGGQRGNQGLANAYKQNQRNTYYMITQPDVDTACRTKIFSCLSEYCGDVTVVPGQRASRCAYSTEIELYNYALLCLQKDTSILLPQYTNNNTRTGAASGGMNTAARLCPSYVQQELMSYLSMANMSEKLNKSHSSLCIERRQELEAAMSCHSVALAYGNETSSMLNSQLTDYCGAGVAGGSSEMVTRFSSAGNVGASIWGWAEKIVNLEMNKKGADWQIAIDSVLAGYTNRMNVACGDNLQMNTVQHNSGSSNQPTSLQTLAALAVGVAFPNTENEAENPFEGWSFWKEIQSASNIFSYAEANQVVQAGLTNAAIVQNSYLNSAQMDNMQMAYTMGTKVFIIRDSARCFIVPVSELTQQEKSLTAQTFANCISK